MMNSVSVQIQGAISEAISTQVLPQIQNVIMAGSGHGTNNLRNEQDGNQSDNDFSGLNVHDTKVFGNHLSNTQNNAPDS